MTEETYDFADLPLQGDGANPQKPSGDYPSIDAVINKPIWCTGFTEDVDTENGKRTLIRFKWDLGEGERLFGRAVKKLLAIVKHPNIRFPFHTIIKVVLIREMAGFEFRSAKEAISQDDIDAYNLYLMKKRSYMKQRR